mgnify:CR=1 FL=1
MDTKERKAFSLIARVGSFRHAFRGLGIFVSRTHNAWIEICAGFIVVAFGYYYSITSVEWLMLGISFGILLMAEAFNTAIEIHMNLTSPGMHPYARDTKDISAGAVLIAVIMFVCCVIAIFLPKIA